LTLVFGTAKVTAEGLISKKMTADFSDIERFGDKRGPILSRCPFNRLNSLKISD